MLADLRKTHAVDGVELAFEPVGVPRLVADHLLERCGDAVVAQAMTLPSAEELIRGSHGEGLDGAVPVLLIWRRGIPGAMTQAT
jgi:hypothetical protein